MARICVFDVNETLLDLSALDEPFARAFGDAGVRREWFAQMIQSALVSTITEAYRNFGEIGAAALRMVAERREVGLTDEASRAILATMRTLPAHQDVAEGLSRLRTAGIRLVTLTNSTLEVGEAQLAHAGIRQYFEQVFSADTARRLKPAPEPYRLVAERLSVTVGDLRLVAAHAWDIAGALHAGCAAAFIARPGMVLDPLVPRPDAIGRDLREVAGQIVERERVA